MLLYAQSLASNVFVYTKPLALQELVGQHPKPFDRAAPAGRSTSATHHPGSVTGMLFIRVHLRDTTKTYHLAIIGKMVNHSQTAQSPQTVTAHV